MIKMLGAAGLCFSLMIFVAGAQSPPPVVSIITAADQPVYDEQSYVGRIQAPNLVRLQARVEGYLERQAFTDGQTVKKGQLLYVIEQPPYQALVDQAAATVAQAEAQTHNAELTLARRRSIAAYRGGAAIGPGFGAGSGLVRSGGGFERRGAVENRADQSRLYGNPLPDGWGDWCDDRECRQCRGAAEAGFSRPLSRRIRCMSGSRCPWRT